MDVVLIRLAAVTVTISYFQYLVYFNLILHRHNLKIPMAVIKSLMLKERHLFLYSRFNQTEETIYVDAWCDGNALDLRPRDSELESQQEHRLNLILSQFSLVPPGKFPDSNSTWLQKLSYKYFTVHYSSIILP
jgi:hypothetical protein